MKLNFDLLLNFSLKMFYSFCLGCFCFKICLVSRSRLRFCYFWLLKP